MSIPFTAADAAAYYRDLTGHYQRYAEGTFGWHYGVWESGTRTHAEALVRANQLLAEGLHLTERSHVLDVGCGAGGFAVWAAREFCCRVTGVTCCEEHVRIGRELAKRNCVEHRCQFILMDMDDLDFDDESFDVICNQESYCYATDKARYLGEVRRLLKPKGAWRAVDFSIKASPLVLQEIADCAIVREGFKIPSLLSAPEVTKLLEEAGFATPNAVDITASVIPTAVYIMRHCHIPLMLTKLHLDWWFFSRDPVRRRNHQGHFRAGMAYSRGLCEGHFRHNFYASSKS